YEYLCTEIDAHWSHAGETERELSRETRGKVEAQVPRVLAHNNKQLEKRLAKLQVDRATRLEQVKSRIERLETRVREDYEAAMAAVAADETEKWGALTSEWN